MERSETHTVASYERSVAASVARIWENVLDWEHLPWLHASSFEGARRIDESPAGWRAWVRACEAADESLVEVAIDRPALRYVTRTIDGPGAGSEIWTTLEPRTDRMTRIDVEFRAAAADPELARRIGRAYVALYERLWSEDEAMMVRRQRLLAAGPDRLPPSAAGAGVPLGSIDEIRARLPYGIRAAGIDLRVVEHDGRLYAHPSVCPHLGGPLEATADGRVACPWHGYRYDLRDGRCVSGASLHLRPMPRIAVDPASGEASLHW